MVLSSREKEQAVVLTSAILNVTIAVSSVAAWVSILVGSGDDRSLSHRGLGSLKYYTVISNLFSAAVSLVYAGHLLGAGGALPPAWLLVLRLAAATVVMVTFFVTLLFLTPQYGFKSLYSGGNFWLHLVCPLLAAADTVFLSPVDTLPVWSTAFAMVPTALYAVGYIRSVLVHGAEKDGQVYDFYGFLKWGEDKIGVVAAVMLLVTWAIAIGLYLAS
jgi:hypothetical protein